MKVGILAIGEISPNQEAYLGNLSRLIGSDVQLDLVSDRAPPKSLANGYRSFVYTLRASSRGIRRLESTTALWRYARSERPDLLTHVIDFETYGLVVAVVGRLLGIRSLVRYAGQVFESWRVQSTVRTRMKTYLLCNILGQLPLRMSDRIVALGPRLAAELVKHGARQQKLTVLPQPVDRSVFHPAADRSQARMALGLPTDKRVVLCVGRLSWLKGADVFLRIVPELAKRRQDLFFCFVGSGPYDQLLRTLPVPNVVTGAVPHGSIADYYRAADLLVHPSRTEGLATALLEAVASGLPVVSRDVGDASLLTGNLFRDEDDLVDYLMQPEWSTDDLPEIFDETSLRRRYLDLLHDVVGVAS